MRLIDADRFKKFLQALCKAGAPYDEIIKLLDQEPTAFDVEKVKAEIRDKRDHQFELSIAARKAERINIFNLHKYARCCFQLSEEIVTRGGIDETNKETHQST